MKKLFTILTVLAILFSCKKESIEKISNNKELIKNNTWSYGKIYITTNTHKTSYEDFKLQFSEDSVKYTESYYWAESDYLNEINRNITNVSTRQYTISNDTLTIIFSTSLKNKFKITVNSDSLTFKHLGTSPDLLYLYDKTFYSKRKISNQSK